jgi:sigma-B regulation protein RsbU (phosphoserine phosphatase)
MPDVVYQQGEIVLEPGDLFVAYTDGISEAMNSSDQEWGEERMLEELESSPQEKAEEIIRRVFRAADDFAKGAPQFDDMTLVVARVVDSSTPSRS